MNEKLFGCKGKTETSLDLKDLCKDVKIDAAVTFPNGKVYIFRRTKYWSFDQKQKGSGQLGKFIDKGEKCADRWKGYKINHDGVFLWNNKLVQIYHKKWTIWEEKGGHPVKKDAKIEQETVKKRKNPLEDTAFQAIVHFKGKQFAALIGEDVSQ